MKRPELLSPVGDFDCLKAAVQNGADSVYLGGSLFNARASAANFDLENLEEAINYAKLRNVKVHLTLNTLIKNNEFEDAINLANKAYQFGVDAIIVQDLGLAKILIDNFPKLPIHASTQMTIHNLEGALKMQELGFKRVVLARELSISEIEEICKSTNIEIETFIHGALCISYSGRCLFSSMIGGRSGNRGKCAQGCRLPYELLDKNESILNKGYLLSPRDLCGLAFLPKLIDAGVDCFKIEGRMKTPEYVATVTRIYRKYIDSVLESGNVNIDLKDKQDLAQVFNRGGFSNGHLENTANKDLIFKEKSNNMGIYLGTVSKYNENKGHIFLDTCSKVSVGDSICFEKEDYKYTISELMVNGKNTPFVNNGVIEIGRMKGNINLGDKIYKVADKELSNLAELSYKGENKKICLNANISVKKGSPIILEVSSINQENSFYNNLSVKICSTIIPETALNKPIDKDRIISQLSKTGNTEFEFKSITVDLEDNLFVPNISCLNDLRRTALSELESKVLENYKNEPITVKLPYLLKNTTSSKKHISLLLNNLNVSYDYSKLENVENIYVPYKFFLNNNYEQILNSFSSNIYIYLPSIIRENYSKLINSQLSNVLNKFNIKGFVLQNVGDMNFLLKNNVDTSKYEIVSNYTLNVFNDYSINELQELGFNKITVSPELNQTELKNLNNSNIEMIVYGKTPVMTSSYCLLGNSNKCYDDCKKYCNNGAFYLKDRMNFLFEVVPDNIETVTTIYNSKITSIDTSLIDINFVRIDILDENIDEINNVINSVKNNTRLEGQDYTNGNFNRIV